MSPLPLLLALVALVACVASSAAVERLARAERRVEAAQADVDAGAPGAEEALEAAQDELHAAREVFRHEGRVGAWTVVVGILGGLLSFPRSRSLLGVAGKTTLMAFGLVHSRPPPKP